MFRHHCFMLGLAAALMLCGAGARAEGGRMVVSLDGTWQIAEGSMAEMPKTFAHTVPVPGLADMASPAFEGVGVKDSDPRREAFWYRRTFTVDGPLHAVAMLKIHKACYGTRAYLNGQLLGDHVGCFTPGYFDVRKHLKGDGQTNELVIRVGAAHTALPDTVPWGHDFEKIRYIPGIYDSVELILSGAPHIVSVQAVPDVPGKKVRVVAVVRAGDRENETAVRCIVREAATGKLVGKAESKLLAWVVGQEQPVDLSTAIENCRLWSPEDPFLYELEVSTGADTLTTRFGMRSFTFDAVSKRAVLNGKPYYLRGTNVCIYRFFEDPLRGDKPWREAWVRQVIRAFRSMHWNSARYCIGFPPEMWYRIADEEGLLIQDEFPVWGGTPAEKVPSFDSLVEQYTEWMQEHWNHPCVAIWDAQNETNSDVTGKALSAVRKLDLSNRPWDNGYGKAQSSTDSFEAHPYLSQRREFRMSDLAHLSPKPGDPGGLQANALPNTGDNSIIINEYGWLWLNRDGTPCTLPVQSHSYEHLLPPNATPEQYREAYARALAAKTEFWRCGRKVAGVLHFCGLGYSRPGGQTSDNFIDIETPRLEPHFFKYVRDAFAPVGLMIDFWADEAPGGAALRVPVVVINDLYADWHGPLTLRLTRGGKTAAWKVQEPKVPALGREVFIFELPIPADPGKYQLVAELKSADGQSVRSLRNFDVKKPATIGGTP